MSLLYAEASATGACASPYLESKTKRLFDVSVCLFLVAFLFPLLLITALFIRVETKGPSIFIQRRNGLREKKIQVLKFRSMRHVPNTLFVQAKRDDCRVTRVGRFIRRTSIDELPQLFNVLSGGMSLVGPRPHPLLLDERYRGLIDRYDNRFSALPGLTGLAQVSGARGETPTVASMQRRIDFDNEYIRKASLLLDLKILLMTARELFLSSARADVY